MHYDAKGHVYKPAESLLITFFFFFFNHTASDSSWPSHVLLRFFHHYPFSMFHHYPLQKYVLCLYFLLQQGKKVKQSALYCYTVHIHAPNYKHQARFNSDWFNRFDGHLPVLLERLNLTESVSIFHILSALLHNAYLMLASQWGWPCVWVRLCIANTLTHSLLTGVFILGLSDDIWHINDRIWPHMLD